jgi:gamma-glutamylcyclotransferase (GGCT)/AIG2-like uncharacterized protein YtfP
MDTAYVFFYGTLMRGFDLRRRVSIDDRLRFMGRATIKGALFDLGPYPAAVSTIQGCIHGELYEMDRSNDVLEILDRAEGYRREDPAKSLYVRRVTAARSDGGRVVPAWAYFYKASLAGARRIPSGDYVEYVRVRGPGSRL